MSGELLSHNMFAYVFNNPINMIDPQGYLPTWLKGVGNLLGGIGTMVAAIGYMAVVSNPIGAVLSVGLFAYGGLSTASGAVQTISALAGVKDEKVNQMNVTKKVATSLMGEERGTKVYGTVDTVVSLATLGQGKVSALSQSSSVTKASKIIKSSLKSISMLKILKPKNTYDIYDKYNSGRIILDGLKDSGFINEDTYNKIIPIFDPDI